MTGLGQQRKQFDGKSKSVERNQYLQVQAQIIGEHRRSTKKVNFQQTKNANQHPKDRCTWWHCDRSLRQIT